MAYREQLASQSSVPLGEVPFQHEAAEKLADGPVEVEVAESTLASLHQLVADLGKRGEAVSPTMLMEASQDENIQSLYSLEPITGLQATAVFEHFQGSGVLNRDPVDLDVESQVTNGEQAEEQNGAWNGRNVREVLEPKVANYGRPSTPLELAVRKKKLKKAERQAFRDQAAHNMEKVTSGIGATFEGAADLATNAKGRANRKELREYPNKLRQQHAEERAEADWQANRKTKLRIVDLPSNVVEGKLPPAMSSIDKMMVGRVQESLAQPDKLRHTVRVYRDRLVPEIQEVFDVYKQKTDETINFYSDFHPATEFKPLFKEDGLAAFHEQLQERVDHSVEAARKHNKNLTQDQVKDIEDKVLERLSLQYLKTAKDTVPPATHDDFKQAYQEFLAQQAQYKALWSAAELKVVRQYTQSRAEAWGILAGIRQIEARQARLQKAGEHAGKAATEAVAEKEYEPDEIFHLNGRVNKRVSRLPDTLTRDEFRTRVESIIRQTSESYLGDDASDEDIDDLVSLLTQFRSRPRRGK